VTDLVNYHKTKLENLRTDRSMWDSQWEEAAARVLPQDRNQFFSRGQNHALGNEGLKKTEFLFDATAALAVQKFPAVIESIMTPKGSKWQHVVSRDKTLKRNRRAREYFEDVTDALFRYRYAPGSGYITNMQQVYLSEGVYGNGVIYVDAPEDRKGLRYRAQHLSESYFVENHSHLVDTMYRPFWLTARQAMQQFGMAVPDAVRDAAGNPAMSEKKFQFVHICGPNNEFEPGAIGPRGKKFFSLYLSLDPMGMVIPGGYNTFPYGVWRYTQAVGETYGRGPAQWVLPSIKLLNEQKKANIKQGHRATDPVLLAHDDGVIDGFVMRSGYINKGGVNADGKLLVQPLPAGNFAISEKMMEFEREVIKDAFLISLFQILIDTPRMTATEVLERLKEKGMLLAPTAGRGEEELLSPMTERELDVLSMQGLLPPMPSVVRDAMDEAEYALEWDSPLSRMRRTESMAGFMQTVGQFSEIVKVTQDPSILDHIAFDRAAPEVLDISGTPVSWTATEEEVAAKREARAQQAQAKQMSEAAPGIAQLVKAMPQAAQGAA